MKLLEQRIENMLQLMGLQEYYPMNNDGDLFDVNYGKVCCFTIDNNRGKAKVNVWSLELWDEDILIGTYSLDEIKHRGGLK